MEIKATVSVTEYISLPACMLFTFSAASFHQTRYCPNLLGKNMFLPYDCFSFHKEGFQSNLLVSGSPITPSQGGKVSYLASR